MIYVVALTYVGCAKCLKVMEVLKQLKTEFPTLRVREIDAGSVEAQGLVKDHVADSSPCLLINNQYMRMADANEESLRKKFSEILK